MWAYGVLLKREDYKSQHFYFGFFGGGGGSRWVYDT